MSLKVRNKNSDSAFSLYPRAASRGAEFARASELGVWTCSEVVF